MGRRGGLGCRVSRGRLGGGLDVSKQFSWVDLVLKGVLSLGEDVYTFVGGPRDAFHDSFPVQEVSFGDGPEGVQDGRGF